jgi:hypothetical protein
MSYLVDTNILLRSVQASHPMHNLAIEAVKTLFEQGITLHVIPQNLIEFWVVVTHVQDPHITAEQPQEWTKTHHAIFSRLTNK